MAGAGICQSIAYEVPKPMWTPVGHDRRSRPEEAAHTFHQVPDLRVSKYPYLCALRHL
ncbi:hypothetical protein GCM10023196_098390 [Actinoallomurus vinaceus]|uniref:Uncharacterized protein n=1 Tax=Actinoallomurus vinaceus TaxID=1080074 RepID=A0ABP8UTD2_9ACTN